MDYLTFQMLWYLIVAFLFGLLVGWFACTPADDEKA
jgi:hypothetical protein